MQKIKIEQHTFTGGMSPEEMKEHVAKDIEEE